MNELSELDQQLIEKELHRKSFADIAFLLDCDVAEIRRYVDGKGLPCYQDKLDAKRSNRPVKEQKPKEPKQKKEKEPTIISRVIKNNSAPNKMTVKNGAWNRSYQTRKVDYSKLKTVRVDDKNHIYVPIDASKQFIDQEIEKARRSIYRSKKALLEKSN